MSETVSQMSRRCPLVRRMFLLPLLFSIALLALLPTDAPLVREVQAQTCAPKGHVSFGGSSFYDWIANGSPSDNSCWTRINATVVTATTCGFTAPAWEFAYGGSISQRFTIPSDMTSTNFNIQYKLDFDDPHNDPWWNSFQMQVYDETTNTVLATDAFYGDMGDLYCASRSKSWTGNLAGHTIRVRFKGSVGYAETHIRVRSIALFQRLN
ncbi:MAG TPA: hypothetical protein VGV59_03605 [Pyrinomonadaceae bacterium]|nr:hypothetical protein [Pyrinomonadaceae bacterium]